MEWRRFLDKWLTLYNKTRLKTNYICIRYHVLADDLLAQLAKVADMVTVYFEIQRSILDGN